MSSGIQNIGKIPELNRRILITILLLAVYRIGVFVPTPGVDAQALSNFFTQARGTLLDFVVMFTGGALEQFSVFALGIMPYISASIIIQLLTVVLPHLERLSKEGESGRRQIVKYTRYGTMVLSAIQGLGISIGLESMRGPAGELVVPIPGWDFRIMTIITLTAGTAFIMWLGEQITERGIGNGISLIIFAGIVARLPQAIGNTFGLVKTGEMNLLLVLLLVLVMIAVIAFIIFVELGQRRIPIQYPKRMVGRKIYGGQSTHLPLKVNSAGVIPPIFASSLIIFPATAVNFIELPWLKDISNSLNPTGILYNVLYAGLIIFFTYFYTAIQFNPNDVAENLKKYGGFVPGIRPGTNTAEYIDRILTRLTLWGAIYLSLVCVLPSFLIGWWNVPFYFGGTSLLIVVGVALDTAQQIESHVLARSYEGLLSSGRLKGRRG
ncbi:MAG: preprotein translocase subunit SecY [Deltaproteobacteria bacterium GWC2_42_51]|nr:MAG: preprotein translocase subunit SecY [Deltaproteobacteria bacterium GWA2_42_85]OGP32701.1 MAG: preprotein translocase subunit SecY [Deltaproteobacteria bacterium GWC2_42_51]OGP39109.1 MAG: preprotein translocase subunit SecY [Deltaproteobacteria bacterium GWD2_42_10]OGP47957.1 MAG: preprotein translocase subunit SecY [Deltaproteobacteria bacterium GWF2_42_12]OGQ24786.1 MAG: preprotein translocase subunit SecY [Deltaproteobacteria bacterium RIFCSPHIGHO2_02_FULL_42_44]OGQ36834.1 MAG: prep